MVVSIFRNINTSDNPIYVEVEKTFERIREGNSRHKIEAIRQCTDKEARGAMKEKLPCVVYQGEFSKRGNDFCTKPSKMICLDFDYVPDVSLAKLKYTKLPYALAVWTSPSGQGVKVLVKVSTTDHTGHFLSLQKEFPEIDKSGKDLGRVCYESYDPEIYINKKPIEYTGIYHEPILPKVNKKSSDYVFECLKSWLQNKGQSYMDGNRNNYTFMLATACNRVGMTEGETEYNILNCIAGADFQGEAQKIVRGVYKRYTKDYGVYEFSDNTVTNKHTKENANDTVFKADDTSGDIITLDTIWDEFIESYENGDVRGDTTYFPEIDEHFRWMRGQFTLLHGYGNFGKTSLLNQLELIKSLNDGTVWMHYTPEQMPARYYFKNIYQSLFGRPSNKSYEHTVTRVELDERREFINKHFLLVYPQKKSPTPDYMLDMFFEGIIKYNVDACVIDPFNQMSHNWGEFARPDLYLEKYLTKFKIFQAQNNIYSVLCTHPANAPKPDRDKPMPPPETWQIKGGGVWNDVLDNILCYHRPYHHIDRSRTDCQFVSQKIRFQQMNGVPGVVDMEYKRETFRFYINNKSPFELTNNFTTEPVNFYEPKTIESDEMPF